MKRECVTDWRKLDPRRGGEPLTSDWLDQRKQELEEIVRPFVTTKKTKLVIEYRGKRRYFTNPRKTDWVERPKCEALARPASAVLALQFLYRMEAARAAGDIDTMINMAIAFARADSEVQNLYWFGADTMQLAAAKQLSKQVRANTRLGKTALRNVSDEVLRRIYEKNYSNGNGWLKATTADINRECGLKKRVRPRTVSTELKRRHIVE
jgi:hypothetical protein